MIDDITKIILTAFVVTAVGIAIRPGSQAPALITALTGGVATMQNAAKS